MTTANSENNNETQVEETQAVTAWHVVQQPEGHCEIYSQAELTQTTAHPKTWGPFDSRAEAIAKRVGLIRAGKCLPK
ncbi:hypothetical protein N836_25505 [Leptolyngbya sp. Heron Island J]|uniref:hypothetical protein n=1 Tax=Leptolyngbya sp. Heron Island J TaxID=1385935 RepID=UPI0003B9EB10|nr:hypothetical protein [Leptolyngbya sp. Heron Island J]ESA32675.1 hypothetical protein N836_25505 [Leptolyngbya sp. Heron Island J]